MSVFRWVAARFAEPSTWAGLGSIALSLPKLLDEPPPGQSVIEHKMTAVIGIVGGLAAIFHQEAAPAATPAPTVSDATAVAEPAAASAGPSEGAASPVSSVS